MSDFKNSPSQNIEEPLNVNEEDENLLSFGK
jgi:hypothetical protein